MQTNQQEEEEKEEEVLTNTEGGMTEEVVVEVEGETRETTNVDSPQPQQEEEEKEEEVLTNTEAEMKEEVVVEVEGETKETTTVDMSQQEEEEEDVCPVCIEPLQKDPTKFMRFTCCGKGIHKWCNEEIKVSSLSQEQKDCCPLCRTEHPGSDEETIERLGPWVEKGKAWAQMMMGDKYRDGDVVLINPTNKQKSCMS